MKRVCRTKKITKRDLGKFCAVKELSLIRTNVPPFSNFIWVLVGFENHSYGQTVHIISNWAGCGEVYCNVWKLPANRIILEK